MSTLTLLLKTKYPSIASNNCIVLTKAKLIEIFDDDKVKRCYIRKNDSQPSHFTINNVNSLGLCFWAIDNCTFSKTDRFKKCDFVIYYDYKIYFCEIKTVEGISHSKKRKEAIQQLKSTTLKLKKDLDLSSYSKDAYFWVEPKSIPRFNANLQSQFKQFVKSTGIMLYEKNEITL